MLSPPPLHAQDAPSPGGPPPASDAAAAAHRHRTPSETLKVNVNLVNVYFSARDKNGFITNLHKDDCTSTRTRLPQTIKNFTQEKNLPLTIGILLDTSGSQMNVLPLEQDSGAEFLNDVLTPKDEAFLISFDINVDLLSDYTNCPRELARAMDKASINTGAGTGSVTGNGNPRGTLLYDAVYLAAHDKLRRETGRKILVLLTDGGDQGSQEKIKTAIEAAQKANAIVYVILIADRGFYGGFGINLADTGAARHGTARQRDRRPRHQRRQQRQKARRRLRPDPGRAAHPIPAQLHAHQPKADGTYRKIDLDCGKDLKVQARKGYYAMATPSAITKAPAVTSEQPSQSSPERRSASRRIVRFSPRSSRNRRLLPHTV